MLIAVFQLKLTSGCFVPSSHGNCSEPNFHQRQSEWQDLQGGDLVVVHGGRHYFKLSNGICTIQLNGIAVDFKLPESGGTRSDIDTLL